MENKLQAKLAIMLAWAGLVLWGCNPQAKAPPAQQGVLLISPVNGYTYNGDSLLRFTALAIDSGKVVSVGTAAALQAQFPTARHKDGQGRTLLPGFTDAHGHLLGLGYRRLQLNLVGIASKDTLLARLKTYAANNPGLRWVVGRGWNQELWPGGSYPTAQELDLAIPNKPVWLERVDGHAGVANSLALKQAAITPTTADPAGGRILRLKDGKPSGVLVDKAVDLIENVLPSASYGEDSLALEKALQELRSLGITSVHDAGIGPQQFRLYAAQAARGLLTCRIYAMIEGTGHTFDSLSRQGPLKGLFGDFLSLSTVKLYQDGALGSRGAALLAPYSDAPGVRGLLFYRPDALQKAIQKAASHGYQVCVHAIGDAANRQVLDAFATLPIHLRSVQRHRIEHAQVISPVDVPRFAQLGILASIQPTHATSDRLMAQARLGPGRVVHAYAWQDLLHAGVKLAAGSDFPVESANPALGFYAAVTRQNLQGEPLGGWQPAQRLSRAQAFHAFTLGAAYAAHQEQRLGSLQPGKWADFILVDRDIFQTPADSLPSLQVLETWVAGKQVYKKPS